ncbi:hypothetical protein G6F63_016599 [Rhizopus arrhizus]|nr:hypothetical protein G6F63_016599 [Rhizopus arrhizus]
MFGSVLPATDRIGVSTSSTSRSAKKRRTSALSDARCCSVRSRAALTGSPPDADGPAAGSAGHGCHRCSRWPGTGGAPVHCGGALPGAAG